MKASILGVRNDGFQISEQRAGHPETVRRSPRKRRFGDTLSTTLNGWIDVLAPCAWNAHMGLSAVGAHTAWSDQASLSLEPSTVTEKAPGHARKPLYSPAERQRRDRTTWTKVQAVLAPIQFLAFAVSFALILRYMITGQGYAVATASILVKAALLYTIMITGSIWEKVVFGKWLFAPAFFWEDAVSMLVLGLQTAYVATLLLGWGTPVQQMWIAIAAYSTYAINASQFLLKLRAARLDTIDTSGLVY